MPCAFAGDKCEETKEKESHTGGEAYWGKPDEVGAKPAGWARTPYDPNI